MNIPNRKQTYYYFNTWIGITINTTDKQTEASQRAKPPLYSPNEMSGKQNLILPGTGRHPQI